MTTTRSGLEPNAPTASWGRYAVLTPAGRGAVATIRIRVTEGFPEVHLQPLFHSMAGRPIEQFAEQRVVYGLWGNDPSEDVVLVRSDLQTIDIHCHGGQAAVRRIADDLEQSGCVPGTTWNCALPDSCPLERELIATLTQATTVRTANWLRRQADGRLIATLRELAQLVQDHTGTSDWQTPVQERVTELLAWSEFGLRLADPRRVVVAGRPNVGKSSLVNALVGFERSVVFDQPGTTRDLLRVQTVLDGWPIEFIDTAGLRQTQEAIEQTGIERADGLLKVSANVILVLDSASELTNEDEALITRFPESLYVRSKGDLNPAWPAERLPSACTVSAVTGQGLNVLQNALIQRLVPRLPPEDAIFPVTVRQVQLLEELLAAASDRETSRVAALLHLLLDGWEEEAA